ncbi:MAG TPA: hypothetical protein VHH72_10530 [Solirubrobacterales bacterium]|jgi:hypothetical protein|nr:hypothetical protein [Solirubrobacterales bacterium]
MRAGAAVPILVGLALLLGACAEKEENIQPVEPEIGTVAAPGATIVQVQGQAAKQLARQTASAVLPAGFSVKPADWRVTCAPAAKDLVICRVRSGPCKGPVVLRPAKVPAGVSPEGYAPKADASAVGCVAD